MPTALNNGFNLISVVSVGSSVWANGWNRDRSYHSGEQWVAECLIYNDQHDINQVIQNEDYLVKKWKLF